MVIVDTNNPAELPPSINEANIISIIDHHMLVGGLKTKTPIDVVIRPLACTATVMHDIIGADLARAPRAIKGAMLSCILSDTLEFRSPTTTPHDRAVAEKLAADLGVDIADPCRRNVRRQIRCLSLFRRRTAAHGQQGIRGRRQTIAGFGAGNHRAQKWCWTARQP